MHPSRKREIEETQQHHPVVRARFSKASGQGETPSCGTKRNRIYETRAGLCATQYHKDARLSSQRPPREIFLVVAASSVVQKIQFPQKNTVDTPDYRGLLAEGDMGEEEEYVPCSTRRHTAK